MTQRRFPPPRANFVAEPNRRMLRHGFGGALSDRNVQRRIVAVVDSDDRLDVARALYWYPVMNLRIGW